MGEDVFLVWSREPVVAYTVGNRIARIPKPIALVTFSTCFKVRCRKYVTSSKEFAFRGIGAGERNEA